MIENKLYTPLLGSSEKLFILFDAIAPKSFTFIAELKGELKSSDLRRGIDAIQKRHPLLKAEWL